MNTKIIIIPAVIGVALIIGAIIYSMPEEKQEVAESLVGELEVTESQVGVLEGTVHYIGKPCPSSKVGPPCDGPYPNYEVEIYKTDGKIIVSKTVTTDEGSFEIELLVGDYIVYETSMDFNKVKETPIMFTIEPDKRKSLEISIDEGIR